MDIARTISNPTSSSSSVPLHPTVIASGDTLTIPSGYAFHVAPSLQIDGDIIVDGDLVDV